MRQTAHFKTRLYFLLTLLFTMAPAAYADNWASLGEFLHTLTQYVDLVLLISALWHMPVVFGRRSVNAVIFGLVVVPTFPVAALHTFLVGDEIFNMRMSSWNERLTLFTVCIALWWYHIVILVLSFKRGKVAARAASLRI